MEKEDYIYMIKLLVILLIILIPCYMLFLKQEEKDYNYCISQGYSHATCRD